MAATSTTLPSHDYDFVIVGGGTAGLTVAARLAESDKYSVLVLEAGSDETANPAVAVPAMWTTLTGSDKDWKLRSQPQAALNERQFRLTQGKLLGGSSALNGQTWTFPSKAGIDAWEKLGNKGWNWDQLAPYFQKASKLNMPDKETLAHLELDQWLQPELYGTAGPIELEPAGVSSDPVVKAWIETFKSLGFPLTGDPASGTSTGGYANLCVRDATSKTRSYAVTGYLLPNNQKQNLTVVTGASVSKILFSGVGDITATGVLVDIDGKQEQVSATREVILAAGPFGSPKMLELSGIGDAQLLEKLDIPVLVDNPSVGEHLQDHLNTGISFEVEDVPTIDAIVRQEPQAIQEAMALYQQEQKGPFAVGGIACHAYMPVIDFTSAEGAKEEADLFDASKASASDQDHFEAVRDILMDHNESSAAYYLFPVQVDLHFYGEGSGTTPKVMPGNFVSLGVHQSHPFSRGSAHISSKDPKAESLIDPKYFSNPLDLEIFAKHVQSLETIAATEPLKSIIKKGGQRNHPDAYIKDLDSAKEYIRGSVTSLWHYCGTCSMLPRNKGGVVDESLRVYGTRNVRVVDTSVFPLLPRSNTMSVAYAVAEKAADIIKSQTV